MVLVERDGSAKCRHIEQVDSRTLKGNIVVHVDDSVSIITDELPSYKGIGKMFDGGHETVNHSAKQYVRETEDGKNINTNTAESFFALLKRGHYGIFHKLSEKHLHRYCDEFSFRWNHRKTTDGERMVTAIRGAEGKRLMYT